LKKLAEHISCVKSKTVVLNMIALIGVEV